MKSIALIVFGLSFNSVAHAEVAAATMQTFTTSDQKVYLRNGTQYFSVSECSVTTRTEKWGDGVLSGWTGTDTQSSDCVPEDSSSNHDRIWLSRNGNGLIVRFDTTAYADVGTGTYSSMNIQADAQAVFTRGNWSTYENGGYVEFSLTDAGGQAISNAVADEICSVTHSGLAEMFSRQGLWFSNFSCSGRYHNRGISNFRGYKTRLREYNRPVFVSTLGFLVGN